MHFELKPAKAHITEFIFKFVNLAPGLFPAWLANSANYYLSDDWVNKTRESEDGIENASLLEDNFCWKAVSVVIRIDHHELELIHRWIRNTVHPMNYDSNTDAKFFVTNYDSQGGGYRSLGWIRFNEGNDYNALAKIDLPNTHCESCYVTVSKLSSGFIYLSLYFFLTKEATVRISNIDVKEIKRYVCFKSINPFSRNFRIIEHYDRRRSIKKYIKNNFNIRLKDIESTTFHILEMWNIKKCSDEINMVSDFYRESDEPYFYKLNEKQNQNVANINKNLTYVLIDRYQNYFDAELTNDPDETYCIIKEDEDIHLDAYFIKNISKNELEARNRFSKIGLRINDSHLFFSLHIDCFKQYKKIAHYANRALLKNNNKPEVNHQILFNSLLKLDILRENIDAIKESISFNCMEKYQTSSKRIIKYHYKLMSDLRSSIRSRRNNTNIELKIEDIKYHRVYSLILAILVIVQIILASLTVDWKLKIDSIISMYESTKSIIEIK